MTDVVSLKPPTTFEQQLEIMQRRGLIIEDVERSSSVLQRINYYRFTAYTLTFKSNDVFHDNVTFETIYRHYDFDAKLRQLLMKLIEYIEISFRTNISYIIAHNYGSDGHKKRGTFRDDKWITTFNDELDSNLGKSRDLFIVHHYHNYQGNFPIWVSVEILQFSWLSKLFNNLKISDQRAISKKYGVHHSEISNWLHFLTITRNRCAHYSRLFDYSFPMHIKFREKDKILDINTNKLFAIIFNMQYLITETTTWNSWIVELAALIEEYDCVDINKLGFKDNWKALLIRNSI